MNARQLYERLTSQHIAFLDCRFMDFPGQWQHATYPVANLTAGILADGFGFDGSLLRGWQAINEADMLLVPDPNSARPDPFAAHPTWSVICDIKDPVTRKTYSRDPRSIARRAEAYLVESGVGTTAFFGPEVEFFVFDHAHFDQRMNTAVHSVASSEAIWTRGQDRPDNRGQQIRPNEGGFPLPPQDSLHDLRSEIASTLDGLGIPVRCHHHESATAGQVEIDLFHDGLLEVADKLLYLKQVVRETAVRAGHVATFMPKPLYGENGSGMHTHFSIMDEGTNVFAGRRYAGLSATGLHAIGGILRHLPALLAFTNPTTNSFKRLTPGHEAPTKIMYASRNRDAAIRIPVYQNNPDTKRLELRFPDPTANPYLAFAAITMAALDGILNRTDSGDPIDFDPADLPADDRPVLQDTPPTLEAALDALEADHGFLTAGGVFPPEVIEHWIRNKRDSEIRPMHERPHPYEFCLYFNQ